MTIMFGTFREDNARLSLIDSQMIKPLSISRGLMVSRKSFVLCYLQSSTSIALNVSFAICFDSMHAMDFL